MIVLLIKKLLSLIDVASRQCYKQSIHQRSTLPGPLVLK